MKSTLIFTQQRWLPRAVDVVLTIVAWALFFYMFVTGFLAVIKAGAQPGVRFGLLFATVDTLLVYLLIGALNAGVLAVWAKYNEIRRRGGERRSAIPALNDDQLMHSFDLPEHLLGIVRGNQIVTVFNDEHGRISDVAAGSATTQWTGTTAHADHHPGHRDSAPVPLGGASPEAAFRAKPSYRP